MQQQVKRPVQLDCTCRQLHLQAGPHSAAHLRSPWSALPRRHQALAQRGALRSSRSASCSACWVRPALQYALERLLSSTLCSCEQVAACCRASLYLRAKV
jgi:hypothetical protein